MMDSFFGLCDENQANPEIVVKVFKNFTFLKLLKVTRSHEIK
jgi:hypothetical protein